MKMDFDIGQQQHTDPWDAPAPLKALAEAPSLWSVVTSPADRALITKTAARVIATDPTVGFTGALLEALAAQGEQATDDETIQQLQRVRALLSRHLAAVNELGQKFVGLQALRAQLRALDALFGPGGA